LTNPASFTTFFVGCSDVLIDGVRVRSRETGNGDGLDFDGCDRVRISSCDLVTGDDAIGLKTSLPGRPNRGFVISNCVISSVWAAVRLGPESIAGMRNIAIGNCVFRDCRDGFKIQSCEGEAIERVVISNIVMEDVLRPFFVTLNAFRMSRHAPPGRPPVGALRDLQAANIRAVVPANPTGKGFDQPCVAFVGVPGHPIEGIAISGFNLTMPGGGTPEHAARMRIPELLNEKLYPEAIHFEGELPASGIYLRHVRGCEFSQCRIATAKPDARAFLAGNDLEEVVLSGVTGHGSETAAGLVKFEDARGVRLVNCAVRVEGRPPEAGIQVDRLPTDRPLVAR
ncbi:MAG: right-handed parallel beta-helix repeat-containing protein, partial [Bryobacterales bacterium]|nr:right-handed parallel beta-helix repeat-containing protein [Bryobacterales bacterium]